MNARVTQADKDGRTLADGAGAAWSYTAVGYALQRSWQRLRESRIGSMLTITMLGITLSLPALFFLLYMDLQRVPVSSETSQSLTLYLDPALPDLDGAALSRDIANRAAVRSARYISREEALATLSEHTDISQSIDVLGVNPLPGAIVIVPHDTADGTLNSAASINVLAEQLKALPQVQHIEADIEWVERLDALFSLAKHIGWLLATLLLLISLGVIGNTIRLEMQRVRKELQVSRLLGASRRFMVRPLLYQGMLYGLLGGAVAIVLATALHSRVAPEVARLAAAYGSNFRLSSLDVELLTIFVIIITFLTSVVSAIIAWRECQKTLT